MLFGYFYFLLYTIGVVVLNNFVSKLKSFKKFYQIFFYYFNNIIPFLLDNQNFSLDFLMNNFNFSSKFFTYDSSLLNLFSLYSNEIVSISQIDNVGFNMYVDSAILLIIVSLILLFSMIAAIIISYYKEKEE